MMYLLKKANKQCLTLYGSFSLYEPHKGTSNTRKISVVQNSLILLIVSVANVYQNLWESKHIRSDLSPVSTKKNSSL